MTKLSTTLQSLKEALTGTASSEDGENPTGDNKTAADR
jgi:hypothetical protein